MQLDIVLAARIRGTSAVNAQLTSGTYAWLLPSLDAADGWARLLSGLAQPIRGEIRLMSEGSALNLYRNPAARSRVGLVLLRESGALLGDTVQAHLKVIASLRKDHSLLERIKLDSSFLEKKTDSLNEHEIRSLHLELAFATKDLKMLVLVEPQLNAYALWAPRIRQLRKQGVMIHLLTSSADRAQLFSSHIIRAEMPPTPQKTETQDLYIVVKEPEIAISLLQNAALPATKSPDIVGAIFLNGLDETALLLAQQVLADEQISLLEWQTINS